MTINSVILELLGVNPEENMVSYKIEDEKLIITKSNKFVENKKKK